MSYKTFTGDKPVYYYYKEATMKYRKLILALIISLVFTGAAQAEGNNEKTGKQKHAEKIKKMEETFWAASKEGKTIKGVFIEGNSLFNGTNEPQKKPFGEPYTKDELYAARQSAERNSKIMFLSEDGTLYFPCPEKGERVTQSEQAHRIPRVMTEEQKKKGLFTWSTPPPLLGRKVEIYGITYPGYAGLKGIHIKSIFFEGEYIVGKN
jgi:hypothetical protein